METSAKVKCRRCLQPKAYALHPQAQCKICNSILLVWGYVAECLWHQGPSLAVTTASSTAVPLPIQRAKKILMWTTAHCSIAPVLINLPMVQFNAISRDQNCYRLQVRNDHQSCPELEKVPFFLETAPHLSTGCSWYCNSSLKCN